MPRPPKNLRKYITPWVAAAQLINLAMQQIMFLKDGFKVRWELKIHVYGDPKTLNKLGIKAFPTMTSYSNGEEA